MTKPSARAASPRFIADLKAWQKRESDIVAGAVIPTAADRYRGHSPFSGSALLELRQFGRLELERDQLPAPHLDRLQHCCAVPTAGVIWSAYQSIEKNAEGLEGLADMLLWHAALRGHDDAVCQWAGKALGAHRPHDQVGWSMSVTLALGMLRSISGFRSLEPDAEAALAEDLRETGFARIGALGGLFAEYYAAVREIGGEDEEPLGSTGLEAALAEMKRQQAQERLEEVLEDRAEIQPDNFADVPTAAEKAAGMVVLKGVILTKPRKDILEAMKPISGVSLPLVSTERVPVARRRLHVMHPHMADEIDAILMTQAARQSTRLNSTRPRASGSRGHRDEAHRHPPRDRRNHRH